MVLYSAASTIVSPITATWLIPLFFCRPVFLIVRDAPVLVGIAPELVIGGGVIPTPWIGGTAPVIGGGVTPVADI